MKNTYGRLFIEIIILSILQERKKRQEELDRLKQEELLKKQQVSFIISVFYL